MCTKVSFATFLRREKLYQTKPLEENFESDEDEADFRAARREHSLAIDALDALGCTPPASFDTEDLSAHTVDFLNITSFPRFSNVSYIQNQALTDFDVLPNNISENEGNMSIDSMVKRRSEMPKSKSVVPKTIHFTFSGHLAAPIRKAGVLECPCAPHIALRDVRKVLSYFYNAEMTNDNSNEIRVKVPAPASRRQKQYSIVIKVEDRHDCSRLSIRPTFADSLRVPNEEFDTLCSDIYFHLLQVRQVVRPYY